MKDYSNLSRAQLISLVSDMEKNAVAVRAEHTDALSDSAARLRAILETAVEGIITIDDRGIMESFNLAAEKIFGYNAREAIGQNVKLLMPEPFRHQHDQYIQNYSRTGHAKIIGIGREVVGRRKDGTVFPMELSVSEVKLAGRRMFTGFIRDITERKTAEKLLGHYAALVESSHDAIIGKTLDGRITSWNRGANEIFGYSAEEMIGRPISLLIPAGRKDEEPRILEKIKQGQSVDHYETIRQRKDGKLIDISVTISPIRDAEGRVVGASKVARDISERKKLEQEIIEISNREQQRIGQDLHDGLCQELAGIQLMCQVLEQKLAAKSKSEAKQVADIAEHIREAISHTRKLARGLSPVELEANGLVSALRELTSHVQKLFSIDCRLDVAVPVLVRDNVAATHLYRIVQEAINNAVKHGKAKHVTISMKSIGEKIVLSVSDDGVGFSPEAKKTAGMGLHIMKYRADVLNAALELRPGNGGGTTVTCIFDKNL